VRAIASPRSDRLQRLLDSGWLDLAWLAFAGANLVAMAVVPLWETVPFHFIWVSLTILYGYRVWGMFPTALVLTFVVASTGVLIIYDILRSAAAPDELTEVPLMGAMFMAMVWHAQRRRSAMEDLRRVSEANLRLLRRRSATPS
jgi:two-component system OmpR family sensor kinase